MAERDSATEALFEVIADQGDPGREAALQLLGMFSMMPGGSSKAQLETNARVLGLLSQDEAPTVQAQLIHALDLDDDPEGQRAAEPTLLQLARSQNKDVRREAIAQLGDVASPSAHAELLRVMQDEGEDTRTRVKAIDRISFEQEPQAASTVVSLSSHQEADIRKEAFGRFREIEAQLALPRLQQALPAEPDRWVRSAILRGLRKHGTESTVTFLEAFVQEEGRDVEARASAQEVLDDLRRKFNPQ